MIAQLTQNSIGFVPPDDAHSFEVYDNNVIGGKCIMYLMGNPDYDCRYSPNLPEGNWKILALGKDLSEEQAKTLVSILPVRDVSTGRSYVCFDKTRGEYATITAIEALQSLLRSKGLQGETTLILKKQ